MDESWKRNKAGVSVSQHTLLAINVSVEDTQDELKARLLDKGGLQTRIEEKHKIQGLPSHESHPNQPLPSNNE